MTLALLERRLVSDEIAAPAPPTVVDVTNGPAPLAGEARFTRFVVPEVKVMYRVARSITGTHADAADLVQDSLVRAFGVIDRFDGRHLRRSGHRGARRAL